jgi:hypothetical protein
METIAPFVMTELWLFLHLGCQPFALLTKEFMRHGRSANARKPNSRPESNIFSIALRISTAAKGTHP